jgi:hypothetical protein
VAGDLAQRQVHVVQVVSLVFRCVVEECTEDRRDNLRVRWQLSLFPLLTVEPYLRKTLLFVLLVVRNHGVQPFENVEFFAAI